jgi:hypothetical protein
LILDSYSPLTQARLSSDFQHGETVLHKFTFQINEI